MINQTADVSRTIAVDQLETTQQLDGYNKDEWDEGGKSNCGYSEGVHDTLMTLGEAVYNVVGEPSEEMQRCMKGIGSYFMEMSYALRDLKRGEFHMVEGDLELDVKESNIDDI